MKRFFSVLFILVLLLSIVPATEAKILLEQKKKQKGSKVLM